MNKEILRMEHISKSFGGSKALEDVCFDLRAGEVHALMGANGAGKSTLMKVLAGVYMPDTGKIIHNGKNTPIKASVADAQKDGVAMVFQELNILPHLNVLENIFIANEIVKHGRYDWKAMERRAREVMAEVGIDLNLKDRAGDLPVATQQMIEITRALNLNSDIIIFDEPTSSLTMQETDHLFALIDRLKKKGVGMVYITHRMSEVYQICDRITLLRDGKNVFSDEIENVDNQRLLAGIVGSEDTNQFPEKNRNIGDVIFEAKNVSVKGLYEDVSFQLREGEILGFAGLAGAGRTEIAKTIFGCYKPDQGEFRYRGQKMHVKSPAEAVDEGIGYVSEDRKAEGILGVRSIKENMGIANMHRLGKNFHIQHGLETKDVQEQIQRLKIKTTGMDQCITDLSGGNQQKVCLGKWIMSQPKLLLLDEPTRGVDVGARADFYQIIQDLVKNKIGVIVISSEEDELIGLCNRIVVMREGHKVGEFEDTEENLKEKMLKLMLNI
ncbi:Ribose import ATP-binding protein RbsA [uncultured Roseburia sp.]|uniref:Ribose/galactose/methyl galactoside import ATP-binding protein n=1 Tax=Brotonthovivens ammoniilytica TaxID=2981725 RepID=A0ABT2TEZ1_9FIRM|nr:sugar ABC transporter ATP-binding protein [Brotonthovivens ammoniilytica]MCU6760759.1 sugar ABC transporter ATP-binding protein [Brotonthovivens ammoniilytica]SCI08359.1 Ribose import ATP-binding protein RbsA [uncultured Roseburia sp.]